MAHAFEDEVVWFVRPDGDLVELPLTANRQEYYTGKGFRRANSEEIARGKRRHEESAEPERETSSPPVA